MLILERFVKSLFLISNAGLLVTYVAAWFQSDLAVRLNLPSGIALHVTLATLSIFLLLFANISSLFYFIGTGRWVKDQAHLLMAQGRKEETQQVWSLYEEANKLKALPMPFATMAIMFGLFTFIMGGAHQMNAIPVWIHPTLATILLIFNMASQWAAFRTIRKNLVILDKCSLVIDRDAPLPL